MKEKHEGITVDGVPLETVIREEEASEIDKVRNREISDRSRGSYYSSPTGKFQGNTSGAKSERSDLAKVEHSEEVKAHLNYLHQKGGIEAVHEFLNNQQPQIGSIEQALKDADNKVRFFEKESDRLKAECQKWTEVRNRLTQAQDILRGKVSVPVVSDGTNHRSLIGERKTRDWVGLARKILTERPTMTVREFRQALLDGSDPNLDIKRIYNAFSNLKSTRIVEEVDGLVALVEKPVDNLSKN
jgi:hypothetical protein